MFGKKPKPRIAIILSLLTPGFGHFYVSSQVYTGGSNNPLVTKAIIFCSAWLIGLITIPFVIGFVILPIAYIAAVTDAKREAEGYVGFRT